MGRIGVASLGAFAGVSMWISLGTLALVDASARTRVGTLPPAWVLVALAAAGVMVTVRRRVSLSRASPLALLALLWLPWLPARVPAAFLIWEGPFEYVVWATVAAAFVVPSASRFAGGATGLLADPVRAPGVAGALMLMCLLLGAAALSERMPAGDEPHYLVITQSLLREGDLRIENNHTRGDYLSYYPFDLRRPDFMRRGTDGEIYSVHLPGMSLLLVPGFALAGYVGALFSVAVVAAIGSALAWHAAWLLTASARAAWTAWVAVGFSAPFFFNAFAIYPDGVGATLAMFVVWLLLRMERGDQVWAPRWLLAAGGALGCLPWLHSRFAIVSAGLGVALMLRLLRREHPVRLCVAFLAIPVVAAAGWFGYFWIIYGAPDPSLPYNGLGQNRIATLAPGISGLLFDQQFGLMANAPVFGVALGASILLARRLPRLMLEVGLTWLVYFLAVASYGMWWAGYSAPARFLLILLWPAALPIAWLWTVAHNVATRAVIAGAIVVGSAIVVARVGVDGGLLVYNSRDGYDLLLGWASRTVNLPLAFPSFHRDVVSAGLRDVAIWMAWGAAAYVTLLWLFRRSRNGVGVVWTVVSAVASMALMLAATMVWAGHGDRILTANSSQLAFLHQWDPAWQTTAMKLRPTRRLGVDGVTEQLELSTGARGGRPAGAAPLLQLAQVPAGRYRVVTNGPARGRGELRISIGRSAQILERWPGSELGGRSLDLPVRAHSITIDGDEEARRLIDHVSLRPIAGVPRSERLTGGYARGAASYGSARVFFLDDNAFMEVPGFWTRGEGDTRVILDRGAPRTMRLRVRNGAVANEVSLVSGGWRTTLDLAVGAVREVDLPAFSRRADVLMLRTRSGFRPVEVDAKSDDLRKLGVWIEFPQPENDTGFRLHPIQRKANPVSFFPTALKTARRRRSTIP
ncbi:MAG: hypothetical protein ABR606_10510 [Vicinamibacterales bacterium]